MEREFDIIVFGATGFTGGLACEYLENTILLARQNERPKTDRRVYQNDREFLQCVPCGYNVGAGYAKKVGDLKWAVGGRDVAKLQKLKDSHSTCSAIVYADSKDAASVDAMVGRTKVLLSFAGPFMLYGTHIVESCAKLGTHYCDSTGEMPWVQSIMKKYHDLAVRNNAVIVPMCGFDCIPSDLGVLYAVQKLRERGTRSIVSATTFALMTGGMSGGTLATGILIETQYKDIVDDPFNLGGGPENDDHLKHALAHQKDARFNEDVNQWTAPFIMENLNTRVVRRSAHDLGYRLPGQGGFRYSECSIAGTEARAKKMSLGTAPPEVRKKLIEQGKLPKPGDGPSFELRRRSLFQSLVNAKADDGKQVWVSITGGDCGYEDTSLMCCESALCLALEYGCLPRQGGVLTPSVALGTTLIERLDRAGIRFRVVPGPQNAIRASL